MLALKNKNLFFFNYIFRIFMITGFSLIIISIVMEWNVIISGSLNGLIFKMPQAIFYFITIIGMISMCVCAIKHDHSNSRANWMEEIINAISQGSLFIGILMSCGHLRWLMIAFWLNLTDRTIFFWNNLLTTDVVIRLFFQGFSLLNRYKIQIMYKIIN